MKITRQGQKRARAKMTKRRKKKGKKENKRDNVHFLEVDRRHDIWKKIKTTKTEIKELEREIWENKKRKDNKKIKTIKELLQTAKYILH